MSITTLSSCEFRRNLQRATDAAEKGPVFITDRRHPTHVLLSIAEYRRLAGGGRSLLDTIAQSDGGDFDFGPPKLGDISRPANLS